MVNMGDYWYGKKGFIDRLGNEVIPCKYDDAKFFREGLAAVCIERRKPRDAQGCRMLIESKWGFYDKLGNEVVPHKYDEVKSFSEGMAAVGIGDFQEWEWGFIGYEN